jgi:hypothetical protein
MGSRAFLLGLFKGMRLELGNPSQFTSFCPQAAVMTSPRSKEIKLVKPHIFIENPDPCTITIVPRLVAIAY